MDERGWDLLVIWPWTLRANGGTTRNLVAVAAAVDALVIPIPILISRVSTWRGWSRAFLKGINHHSAYTGTVCLAKMMNGDLYDDSELDYSTCGNQHVLRLWVN